MEYYGYKWVKLTNWGFTKGSKRMKRRFLQITKDSFIIELISEENTYKDFQ